MARINKEDQNVDRTDVAQTSQKVNQKETKSLKRARNQNQRNRKMTLSVDQVVAGRTNQEDQNVDQMDVDPINQEEGCKY